MCFLPGGKVPAAQDGGRWVLSPALEVPSRPLSQAALPCARRSARAQRRCHLPQSYGQRDCAARGECHAQVGAAAFLPFLGGFRVLGWARRGPVCALWGGRAPSRAAGESWDRLETSHTGGSLWRGTPSSGEGGTGGSAGLAASCRGWRGAAGARRGADKGAGVADSDCAPLPRLKLSRCVRGARGGPRRASASPHRRRVLGAAEPRRCQRFAPITL